MDLPGARLVVLDSLLPGSGAGRLGRDQLDWLADTLARAGATDPARPVLIALHHPPAPVGMPFLDAMALTDADALVEVLSTARAGGAAVARVLCGHVHRVITATIAGTVLTCASTYRQSALDLDFPGRMGYLDEPASLLLHQLTDTTGAACVSHVVPITSSAVHFSLPPQ